MFSFSKKDARSAILAVTIGNILEWYEIYTYIYLAPTISKLFFAPQSGLSNIINVFLVFAIGFLARPFGGIFFGRLGDLVGRRKALILSVVMMSIPTFIMGLMPTYQSIGFYSALLLVLTRLLQSFPAGGEFPGAFCYLYETAPPSQRRFITSWGAVGNQIGIILALIEAYVLDNCLTRTEMLDWGWRLAFISGSLLGVCGFFLRYNLHETPLFKDLSQHNRITRKPIINVISEHKSGIIKGILYCTLDAVGFYLLSSLVPIYFKDAFGISYSKNIIITISFLALTTLLLPVFGKLGDKYSNKKMLIISTVSIMLLTLPLYYYMQSNNIFMTALIYAAITIFLTCLSALIPYLLSSLFPTAVRFTCVALSFNLVDGIIGGFTPLITLDLFKNEGFNGVFALILILSAVISLFAYLRIREGDLKKS